MVSDSDIALTKAGLKRYRSDPDYRSLLAQKGKGRPTQKVLLLAFAERGEAMMVKDLLERGVPTDSRRAQMTPLCMAAGAGRTNVVSVLLAHGASVDFRGPEKHTPLHMAVAAGHKKVVQILLDSGANPNAKNNQGLTPLHIACANRNAKLVDLLVSKGADVTAKDKDGLSPLTIALRQWRMNIFEILLRSGVRLDLPDSPAMEACVTAVKEERIGAVRLFLKHGADVAYTKDGLTLLHHAAETGNSNMVLLLLKEGSEPDADDNSEAVTPLFVASSKGQIEVTGILISQGANVNHETADHETPLIGAAKMGHDKTVRLLLQKRADINARDHRGATAIYGALENGHLETVKTLVEAGAEVNVSDSTGRTLLEVAVRKKNASLVRILLQAGADVNTYMGEESSLLELAFREGTREIAEILQRHGALFHEGMERVEKERLLLVPEIARAAGDGQFDRALGLLEGLSGDDARSVNSQMLLKTATVRNEEKFVKIIVNKYPKSDLKEVFVSASEHGNCELLKLFMDLELKSKGDLSALSLDRALETAVRVGDKSLFELLLKHHSLSNTNSDLGEQLLHLAGIYGHTSIAKQLFGLGFGVAKGKLTEAGMRILHEAVEKWDQKAIDSLLKKGTMSKEILFEKEQSIMTIVAVRNEIDLAKRLIDRGIDVNATGRNGTTPLMRAASLGHSRIVKLLLFKGAHVNLMDDQERTALDHAVAQNRIEIIRLLKASGGKPASSGHAR